MPGGRGPQTPRHPSVIRLFSSEHQTAARQKLVPLHLCVISTPTPFHSLHMYRPIQRRHWVRGPLQATGQQNGMGLSAAACLLSAASRTPGQGSSSSSQVARRCITGNGKVTKSAVGNCSWSKTACVSAACCSAALCLNS